MGSNAVLQWVSGGIVHSSPPKDLDFSIIRYFIIFVFISCMLKQHLHKDSQLHQAVGKSALLQQRLRTPAGGKLQEREDFMGQPQDSLSNQTFLFAVVQALLALSIATACRSTY